MALHELTYDIYLLLRPFREQRTELCASLAPLEGLERRLAVSVEGYYSPHLDTALIALQFDRGLASELGYPRLRSLVASIGIPTITPEELGFERRCEFYLDHLSNYSAYIRRERTRQGTSSQLREVLDALTPIRATPRAELARRARTGFARIDTPVPA